MRDLAALKRSGQPIAAVTAYDALFGRLVDEAGVDLVLVGDSVGNVVAGYPTTLPVTLEQMIYHASAARRGVQRALVVADMPFMTYQVNDDEAVRNCGTMLRESGVAAVKMEGGSARMAATVERVVAAGIPVMGHIGFTPQSVHAMGGYRVQGRGAGDAARLLREARRLEEAGVFALVLELLPASLARDVTASLGIPTIGIGAGVHCDGQVLVLPDLLGLNDAFAPRFLKRYARMADDVRQAVRQYASDVRGRQYPGESQSF